MPAALLAATLFVAGCEIGQRGPLIVDPAPTPEQAAADGRDIGPCATAAYVNTQWGALDIEPEVTGDWKLSAMRGYDRWNGPGPYRWSDDGNAVVSAGFGHAVSWDPQTGKARHSYPIPKGLDGFGISTTGDRLAFVAEEATYLLDFRTGELTRLIDQHAGHRLHFSTDETVLYGEKLAWDLRAGKLLWQAEQRSGGPLPMVLSSGRELVEPQIEEDTWTFVVRKLGDPSASVRELASGGDPLRAISASLDGTHIAVASDGIRVIRVADGAVVADLPDLAWGVELSPSARYLLGWWPMPITLDSSRGRSRVESQEPYLALWDLHQKRQLWRRAPKPWRLDFAGGERYLVPRAVDTKVLEVRSGRRLDLPSFYQAMSPDGSEVAVKRAGTGVEILPTKSGVALSLPGLVVARSDDGRFLITRDAHRTMQVESSTGCRRRRHLVDRPVFFSGGERFALAYDTTGFITFASQSMDEVTRVFTSQREQPVVYLIPKANQVVMQDGERDLVFYDISTGARLRTAHPPGSRISMIEDGVRVERRIDAPAWLGRGVVSGSADGRYLAKATGAYVEIWDTRQPENIVELPARFTADTIALSKSADVVVVGGREGQLRLWRSNQPVPLASQHQSKVTDVVLSEDEQFIVSASEEGIAKIHDTRSGTEVGSLDLRPRFDTFALLAWSGPCEVSLYTGRGAELKWSSDSTCVPPGSAVQPYESRTGR